MLSVLSFRSDFLPLCSGVCRRRFIDSAREQHRQVMNRKTLNTLRNMFADLMWVIVIEVK